MKDNVKTIVGISIGDVNGIGPEIILRTFSDVRLLDLCTPIVYGSMRVIDYYKKTLLLPDLAIHQIEDVQELKKNKINVLNCLKEDTKINEGFSTSESGKLAYEALIQATSDIKKGLIDVLVTAPINKKGIRNFHEGFTGHTGYLSEIDGNEALMLLCSEKMRIAMVTGHISLSEIKNNLNADVVIAKIEALNKSLKQDFGIVKPRIAVLGLNPHAGEEGLMGSEEIEIILPAIDQAKTKGIIAVGPYPSDGFFGSGNYLNFDAVLAMYHDQALIPFKTLSFENGVNYSAGLSFVRTSPDHGTAYEIAGKGLASESSFRSAVYAACDIFKKRKEELNLEVAEEA